MGDSAPLEELVIIGLPSAGLELLASSLNARKFDEELIPMGSTGKTGDAVYPTHCGLMDAWSDYFAAHRAGAVLVYGTPWSFLAQELEATASVHTLLRFEVFARATLGLWHAYNLALFELRRKIEERAFLINGDRPVDVSALSARIEQRFTFRAQLNRQSVTQVTPKPDYPETDFREMTAWLAPECVELYVALESCADLMGRRPEFWRGAAVRRTQAKDRAISLLKGHGSIASLLDRFEIEPGHPADRIESVLRSRREALECVSMQKRELEHMRQELANARQQIEDLQKALSSEKSLAESLKLEHVSMAKRELEPMRQELANARQQIEDLQKALSSEKSLAESLKLEHVSMAKRELEPMRQELANARQQIEDLQKALSSEKSLAESLKKEQALYLQQIQQIEDELKQSAKRNHEQEARLAGLRARLDEATAPITRKIARRTRALLALTVRFTASVATGRWRSLWRAHMQYRALRKHLRIVRRSGLFDTQWYLTKYPDVSAAGLDAVEHYLRFGAAEGRNPGPGFDTRWYLRANPDVAAAGVNPLLHYIEFGQQEGRQPTRRGR